MFCSALQDFLGLDNHRLFRLYSIDCSMRRCKQRKFYAIRMVEMFLQSVLCLNIMDKVLISFIDQFCSEVDECLHGSEGDVHQMLGLGHKCLQDLKAFIDNIFGIFFDNLYEDCKMIVLRSDNFAPECTTRLQSSTTRRIVSGSASAAASNNHLLSSPASTKITTFDEFLGIDPNHGGSGYDQEKLQHLLVEKDSMYVHSDSDNDDGFLGMCVYLCVCICMCITMCIYVEQEELDLMRMDDETLSRVLRESSVHHEDYLNAAANAHKMRQQQPVYYQNKVEFLKSDKCGEYDRDDWVKRNAEEEVKTIIKIAVRRQIEMQAFLGMYCVCLHMYAHTVAANGFLSLF